MNGDSQKIVELLSQKIDDLRKQLNQRMDDLILTSNQRIDEAKNLIDNHCGRIRKNTNTLEVIKTELEPIKKFYNRITDFSVGIIIFVGSIIGGIIYFLKNKY